MRIVVVSDTHRDFNALVGLVKLQADFTDLFIHLGDGERDLENLRGLYPRLPLLAVRGNCDLTTTLPDELCTPVGHVKIFMCHGHLMGVKHSLESLYNAAKEGGATIALYGHTHAQLYEYRHGMHIMNPGSLSFPRGTSAGFGVIEIKNKQVVCNLKRLESLRG